MDNKGKSGVDGLLSPNIYFHRHFTLRMSYRFHVNDEYFP